MAKKKNKKKSGLEQSISEVDISSAPKELYDDCLNRAYGDHDLAKTILQSWLFWEKEIKK